MDENTIRAFIFLVAGLIVILFPNNVYKFQTYILKKLHIKNNLKNDKKIYNRIGIVLLIIAIILFIFSIYK